jgi:hypothetical protein
MRQLLMVRVGPAGSFSKNLDITLFITTEREDRVKGTVGSWEKILQDADEYYNLGLSYF